MIKTTLLALAICFCTILPSHASDASDLEALQGNWETKTTTRDGDKVTQHLEISKDKLIFKLLDTSRAIRFYAIAKLKVDKAGPFNVLKVTEIKAGASESDTSPVDDERTTIYQLRDGTLILASNLEKERDIKPALDVYEKVSK